MNIFRDLRETKHKLDSTSSDVKKKDGQLKELQFRIEHGEGCELIFTKSFLSSIFFIYFKSFF